LGLAALEIPNASLRNQRYVIFLSWKEEFYKKTVIYEYTSIYINDLINVVFKVYILNMYVSEIQNGTI
jgi:hypothetical protein